MQKTSTFRLSCPLTKPQKMTVRNSFGLRGVCHDSLDKYQYGISTFVITSIYQEDTKARQQYYPIAAEFTSPFLFTAALVELVT